MEFFFDFFTPYLSGEHSERVRYQVGHDKRFQIYKQLCIISLHKHTNDGVSQDFPKLSKHFPKLFLGQANVSEHSLNISEDCRQRFDAGCFDHALTHLYINTFKSN